MSSSPGARRGRIAEARPGSLGPTEVRGAGEGWVARADVAAIVPSRTAQSRKRRLVRAMRALAPRAIVVPASREERTEADSYGVPQRLDHSCPRLLLGARARPRRRSRARGGPQWLQASMPDAIADHADHVDAPEPSIVRTRFPCASTAKISARPSVLTQANGSDAVA